MKKIAGEQKVSRIELPYIRGEDCDERDKKVQGSTL